MVERSTSSLPRRSTTRRGRLRLRLGTTTTRTSPPTRLRTQPTTSPLPTSMRQLSTLPRLLPARIIRVASEPRSTLGTFAIVHTAARPLTSPTNLPRPTETSTARVTLPPLVQPTLVVIQAPRRAPTTRTRPSQLTAIRTTTKSRTLLSEPLLRKKLPTTTPKRTSRKPREGAMTTPTQTTRVRTRTD